MRAWLGTKKYIERVHRRVEPGLQHGYAGLHLRQSAFRLTKLELGCDAFLILQADDIDQSLLSAALILRDLQPGLKGTDDDVAVGDLRGYGKPSSGNPGLGGLIFRAGGLLTTAKPSEQINFPRCPHAKVVKLSVTVEAWRSACDAAERCIERLMRHRRRSRD